MVSSRKRGSWFSRGKLLLTGEYMVLHGATALALPVKFGQGLEWKGDHDMDAGNGRTLSWVTYVRDKEWFRAVFGIAGNNYVIKSSPDDDRAAFLLDVLNAAAGLSDMALPGGTVESSVGFDMGWGLGSSSSLISNVAWMFDINPFALHFAVSRGSGYDIACARSDSPVTYRLQYGTDRWSGTGLKSGHDARVEPGKGTGHDARPDTGLKRDPGSGAKPGGSSSAMGQAGKPGSIAGHTGEEGSGDSAGKSGRNGVSDSFPVPVHRKVDFNPPFAGCLYFAYTGRKKDSAESVSSFLSPKPDPDTTVAGTPGHAMDEQTGEPGIRRPGGRDSFSQPAGITAIVEQVTFITQRILDTDNIDIFTGLLREHDRIIAPLVDEVHPRDGQFTDLPGYVKPLGAWGGDFVMIVWKDDRKKLIELLRKKGIDVVFSWDELIITSDDK